MYSLTKQRLLLKKNPVKQRGLPPGRNPKKDRERGKKIFPDLPVVVIEHSMSEEELRTSGKTVLNNFRMKCTADMDLSRRKSR